jgi:eukaryotic-like serine/threonine-protein kinase
MMSKPDNLIGKQIDQFSVEAFIARGAMGMVFKAFDTVLARTVALKLIPKATEEDLPETREGTREEARKRLIQEAKAAGKLTQPNIVTIHAYGETDEFQYICMEYISGKTLAEILKERGKIPVDEAVPIFEQILLALEAADQENIVHRDIKPSNIMITRNNLVKVMDFGIAKLPSLSMTVTGMVLGTPYYMSPEQISGKKVDIRSDIFSLGAVVYEVLTGEKPFEGESTATLTYKIIQIDPIPPNVINQLVPDRMVSIVSKALHKDPSKRYQNPTEMLSDLRRLSSGPSRASGSETVVSAPLGSTVLANRIESADVGAEGGHPPDRITGTERKTPAAPADRKTASSVSEDGDGPEPEDQDIGARDRRKGSAKHGASRSDRAKEDKRPNMAKVAAVLLVLAAGVVFAWKFMSSEAPQPIGKQAPQPPVTLRETVPHATTPPTTSVRETVPHATSPPTTSVRQTIPQVTPPSVDSRPKPTAQALLVEAGKLFTSDPEGAQTLLEQALALEPNNYDCSVALARVLSHKKDYAAAIQEYQHALRLDNRFPDVHYELGSLYLGQGEYDSAIESLENALTLKPKNRDEVLANLGLCHLKKGDFARARLLFRQSLNVNPDNAAARTLLASMPTPATQPPVTQPPATQPPTTQPPATKPPATQPPATTPPKPQGAGVVAGQWEYSITLQNGQVVIGQLAIDATKGDQFKMIATASYRMRGQDGLFHQLREKNYFAGTFRGQNLMARCDKADFTIDGRQTPVPGLPLQVSLFLNADGRTMQGHVVNSLGNSAPLYVRKQ